MKISARKRVVASAIVLTVLASPFRAQTKPVYNSSPLTEEQLSVYRGFLDKFGALHIKNLSKAHCL